MQTELLKLYSRWLTELTDKCPELLSDKYSNPHYVSIPKNWENAKHRVMIVGEEGYGSWGNGKGGGLTLDNIEKIQYWNNNDVEKILNSGKDKRKFWRRFIEISKLGYPCIWNNLDKIFVRGKKNCRLSVADRNLLHTLPTKILKEEIGILKPDIVIFFGWYYDSLSAELPEVCARLYPKGKKDNSLWKLKVCSIDFNGGHYIFTYHPSWHGKYKPLDYEDNVLNCIKSLI